MAGSYTSVRVAYDGKNTEMLVWFVTSVVLSVLTLGLYLPIAVNRLVTYVLDNTELQIQQLPVSNSTDEQPPAKPA